LIEARAYTSGNSRRTMQAEEGQEGGCGKSDPKQEGRIGRGGRRTREGLMHQKATRSDMFIDRLKMRERQTDLNDSPDR
jgi:hypothetical protein